VDAPLNAKQLKPEKQLQINEEFRCTGSPGPYFIDMHPLFRLKLELFVQILFATHRMLLRRARLSKA